MRNTTRDLVTLAVFGALWGLVEISLGSVLHAIHVPLTGLGLAAAGLTIALVGRAFVPKRGTTLFIGVIATILKLFSIGAIIIGPMIGILSEALLAELVLSLFRRPRRLAFMLAGMLGALTTLIQPFITGLLIFGRDLFSIWFDTLALGSRLFGFDSQNVAWILLALLALHLAIGAAAGWLAWWLARLLTARMGQSSSLLA